MIHRHRPLRGALAVLVAAALAGGASSAQTRPERPKAPPAHVHGSPPGWKFTPPPGDAGKGREVFAKLECHTCHEAKGHSFPAPDKMQAPELSMVAAHHDAAFIFESIINPDAVLARGMGFEGPDGRSKMPSFNDAVTVQEIADLVAFIQALAPRSAPAPAPKGGAGGHRH